MKKNKFLYPVIVFAIVLSFLALTLYIILSNFCSNISWEQSIVPLDIVSLLASSLITLYVGYNITKGITEQRAEKEILIEDFRNLENSLKEVEKKINDNCDISLSSMASITQKVMLQVVRIQQTITIFFPQGIDIQKLSDSCMDLHTVATNFDEPTIKHEDYPSEAVYHCCTGVICEIRKLIHNINVN